MLPEGDNLDQSHTPGLRLKTDQIIKYTDNQSGQIHTGKILSRAGKPTGKHKIWDNLQYSEPEEIAGTTASVNLGQTENVQVNILELFQGSQNESGELYGVP